MLWQVDRNIGDEWHIFWLKVFLGAVVPRDRQVIAGRIPASVTSSVSHNNALPVVVAVEIPRFSNVPLPVSTSKPSIPSSASAPSLMLPITPAEQPSAKQGSLKVILVLAFQQLSLRAILGMILITEILDIMFPNACFKILFYVNFFTCCISSSIKCLTWHHISASSHYSSAKVNKVPWLSSEYVLAVGVCRLVGGCVNHYWPANWPWLFSW